MAMKVNVDRKALLAVLKEIQPVKLNKGGGSEESTLLTAKNGRLLARRTNLEVALAASCEASYAGNGGLLGQNVCVPSKPLFDYVKAAKGEEVLIEWEAPQKDEPPKKCQLSCGELKISLLTDRVEDFPGTPDPKGKKIQLEDFALALREVLFSIATEESRPVLNAVQVSNRAVTDTAEQFELAAADGFTLSVTGVRGKGWFDSPILVPHAAAKLLSKWEGPLTLVVNGGNASFARDGVVMVTMLTQGTYPNYQVLIPDNTNEVTFSRDAFLEGLKQLMVVKPKIVRLQVGEGQMILSCLEDDVELRTTIPAEGKLRQAFNPAYLKRTVESLGSEVCLKTDVTDVEGSRPVMFVTDKSKHVIMPMFVKW